jgi:hypothetical protein
MQTGKRHRPGRRQGLAVAFGCACALALAACHQAPPPPSNVTPDKAVMTNLRLTATGDFDGLMRNRLPPAEYAQWRREWDKQHAHPVPASVAQQQQFAKIMQMLTEPGAEDKLAKRLQPDLARLRSRKGEDMPILAGILDAAGKQMIANSPQLGPAQRTLVAQGFDAFTAWAKTVDFGDPGKARKAIDVACATARQLHVQTLAQWRALDYATTMKNYGIIWNGLESVLNIYGLDLARALNDAKVESVSHADNRATVKLAVTLAGKPLAAEWPMVQQQGHWYDEALVEAWRKAHPSPASGTSAAPAGSAGAGTPAGGSSVTPPGAATAPGTARS